MNTIQCILVVLVLLLGVLCIFWSSSETQKVLDKNQENEAKNLAKWKFLQKFE